MREVTVGVLVLGSSGDAIVSVGDVEAAERANGVKAVIFGRMGNNTMLEPGWRQVADRMLAWFKEKGL